VFRVTNREDVAEAGVARVSFIEQIARVEVLNAPSEGDAHYAVLLDGDQPTPDEDPTHYRAQQVTQQVFQIERRVEQLRRL